MNQPSPTNMQQSISESTLPDTERATWRLRFQNPTLEKNYLHYIIERDRVMARQIMIITVITALLFAPTDPLNHLTELAWITPTIRLPLFSLCVILWLSATIWTRLFSCLPKIICGCCIAGVAILSINQWLAWQHGIPNRPYQPLLIVVLFAPLLGCMPLRLGMLAGAGAGLLLALPEWYYQPDHGLRTMHLVFIFLFWLTGVFTGYVHELLSRQHFLTNYRYLQQSRNDPLTNLPNRRDLDTVLPRLIRQAARDHVRMAVAMLDVDHFKAYNDHYGHAAGDEILKAISLAISQGATPKPDFVARYGGEEFVAIWYRPTHPCAQLAEGLRHAVEALALPHQHSQHGIVTISVGIACQTRPSHTDDARQLLLNADKALYHAKESGRNRITVDATSSAIPLERENARSHAAPLLHSTADQQTNIIQYARVTPAAIHQWQRLRGFFERPQLANMARVVFITNTLLAIIAHYSLPANEIGFTVAIQTFIAVPLSMLAIYATRLDSLIRHARHIIWLFALPSGLALCYALSDALRMGITLPAEPLIIVIFHIYFVGGQSWRTAALTCWLITLGYLIPQLIYNPTFTQTIANFSPFIMVNGIGMLASYAQDRQSLDTFIKKGQLERLASQDSLTGLANRHGLQGYFHNLLPVLGTGQPLAVAMIDVDHFKNYNDHYGHAQGDEALIAVARVLREHGGSRPYDFVTRYGGEEFVIIWYQLTPEQAQEMGERLCQSVRELNLPHAPSPHGRVTISVGLAHGTLQSTSTLRDLEHLIVQADLALYHAKAAGRDRVSLAPSPSS